MCQAKRLQGAWIGFIAVPDTVFTKPLATPQKVQLSNDPRAKWLVLQVTSHPAAAVVQVKDGSVVVLVLDGTTLAGETFYVPLAGGRTDNLTIQATAKCGLSLWTEE